MADDFRSGNLRRLSDADLSVAENEPDVRGWTVVTTDGRELGDVDDLIVDTDAMKVRYLEVDSSNDGADHMYVPLANADLDRDEERVVVRGADADTMRTWASTARSSGIERTRSDRTDAGASDRDGSDRSEDARRLTRSEEEVHVATRPVQAGEVRVGKHVETEHVRQQVPVSREEVHVERRPVSGRDASGEIRASESEIRVPVTEEEVVVEKRPVVKEELVISKERVQDTKTVDTEVRKEEFDIHDDRRSREANDVAGNRNRRGDE